MVVVEFRLGWRCRETTAEEGTDRSLSARRLVVLRGRSQTPRTAPSRTDRARPAHIRRAGGGPLRARAQPRRQPHDRRHAALPAGDPPGARRQRRSRAVRSRRSDRRGDHARARDRAARSRHQRQRLATHRTGPAAGSLAAPTQHAADSTPSPAAPVSALGDRLLPPRRRRRLLVVQLASGTGPTSRGHPRRTLASSATAPTSGLIEAATNRFLAVEHAADRNAQPATTAEYSRVAARAAPSPASTCPHLNIVWQDPPPRARPHHQQPAHRSRPTPPSKSAKQAPARPRAPRPPDRVNHPQRPSRTPCPTRTRARAPPANPKPPSAHSSQEPAPAAASSPHTSNVHRKVEDT